jgi:hypothetical protein
MAPNPLDIARIIGSFGGSSNVGGVLGQIVGKQAVQGRPAFRGTGTFSSGRSVNELLHPPGGGIGSQTGIPEPGSLAEILSELQRLQNPNRYAVDESLLERQAMAQAAAQYDPLISALAQQGSAAQARAGRNSQQLGSMYTGLSNSLMGDIAPIQQQFSQAQNKTAEQYAGLQQGIKDQYAASQAEQEAMMKRLNIEAAAPTALEGQFKDRDFAVTQAAQQGQNVQSQLEQQGAGAVTYTRQGSELARTEGTNRQADLMAALSDYLNQVQGQIGAQKAAKSAAYQSNLLGLEQDASKSAVQNAQRDFENYIKVLGVMKSMQPETPGAVGSPSDVAPRVMGLGLDPGSAQQVTNAFMSAISSDDLILAGTDPSSGMGLTKEALAKRVVEAGRQRGLNAQQLNALQNVALEYFGRQ